MPYSPRKGIALMVGASFCFAVMAALVKKASAHVPFFEIVFARSFVMLIFAGVMTLWAKKPFLGNNRPMLFTRSIVGFASLSLGFYVNTRISLANATLLNYTSVFFAPLLSVLLLKEKTTPRFWISLAIAFIGVILVAKPDFAVMNLVGLLGLVSGFLSGVAFVSMKKLHSTDDGMTIVFNFAFWSSLCSLILGGGTFTSLEPNDLLLLFGTGVSGTIGQICLTNSFRYAPTSVVSPFVFTVILFSTLFGAIFWGEFPDQASFIGGAMVVLSGIAITQISHRREHEVSREKPSEISLQEG